jgi:hypothetical protein
MAIHSLADRMTATLAKAQIRHLAGRDRHALTRAIMLHEVNMHRIFKGRAALNIEAVEAAEARANRGRDYSRKFSQQCAELVLAEACYGY